MILQCNNMVTVDLSKDWSTWSTTQHSDVWMTPHNLNEQKLIQTQQVIETKTLQPWAQKNDVISPKNTQKHFAAATIHCNSKSLLFLEGGKE